jgi:hypothetical protein
MWACSPGCGCCPAFRRISRHDVMPAALADLTVLEDDAACLDGRAGFGRAGVPERHSRPVPGKAWGEAVCGGAGRSRDRRLCGSAGGGDEGDGVSEGVELAAVVAGLAAVADPGWPSIVSRK